MGTSVACVFATIFYSYHEEKNLQLALRPNIPLYKRFIDDAIVLVINDDRHYQQFHSLINEMNAFGKKGRRLTWEATKPARTIDFLDLTITINPDGSITTKTYQKPMNLYLYLPACSAHPPGMLKALVHGVLGRYYRHNSNREDFNNYKDLFYNRLLARGYSKEQLDPTFNTTIQSLETKSENTSASTNNNTDTMGEQTELLFLHGQYHTTPVPRRNVQKIFQTTCAVILANFENARGDPLRLNQLTIAYSRPPNIGDIVRQAKLITNGGEKPVSSYIVD